MNRNLTTSQRGVVFEWRNNPRIKEILKSQLTLDGRGIVDYDTGWSWDPTLAEENRQHKAKEALETMETLDYHGGYGVIHTEGFEEVSIGRAVPGCVSFQKYPDGTGELKKYKTLQLEEWTVMEKETFTSNFETIHEKLQRIDHSVPTLTTLDGRAIPTAFTQLDLAGEIRSRR